MSIFSKIRDYFTPKVIFVGQSELSNPRIPRNRIHDERLEHSHIEVLKIIGNQNGIKASEIDRKYNSGGRRANDLYHWGYALNVGNKSMFKYTLSEKGINTLNKL